MSQITQALYSCRLLDDEGYLLPPEHPNVRALTEKMMSMMELAASGVKLTPQVKQEMKTMQMAFDYYNDALIELEENGIVNDDGFIVDDHDSEPSVHDSDESSDYDDDVSSSSSAG